MELQGLKMLKQNRPTVRARRVDEKNRVSYLVIMFSNIMLITAQN